MKILATAKVDPQTTLEKTNQDQLDNDCQHFN